MYPENSGYLDTLGQIGHDELSAKHAIPESACDSKSILVVLPVVIEVVGLELTVKGWKPVKIQLDVSRRTI